MSTPRRLGHASFMSQATTSGDYHAAASPTSPKPVDSWEPAAARTRGHRDPDRGHRLWYAAPQRTSRPSVRSSPPRSLPMDADRFDRLIAGLYGGFSPPHDRSPHRHNAARGARRAREHSRQEEGQGQQGRQERRQEGSSLDRLLGSRCIAFRRPRGGPAAYAPTFRVSLNRSSCG